MRRVWDVHRTLREPAHRFRRPEVPGFWPSNGLVGTVCTDMAKWQRKAGVEGLLDRNGGGHSGTLGGNVCCTCDSHAPPFPRLVALPASFNCDRQRWRRRQWSTWISGPARRRPCLTWRRPALPCSPNGSPPTSPRRADRKKAQAGRAQACLHAPPQPLPSKWPDRLCPPPLSLMRHHTSPGLQSSRRTLPRPRRPAMPAHCSVSRGPPMKQMSCWTIWRRPGFTSPS